jgi:hypothetical protein
MAAHKQLDDLGERFLLIRSRRRTFFVGCEAKPF